MVSQETYCIKIKHSFENTFANIYMVLDSMSVKMLRQHQKIFITRNVCFVISFQRMHVPSCTCVALQDLN